MIKFKLWLLVAMTSHSLCAYNFGQLTSIIESGEGELQLGLAYWYSSSVSYTNGGVTFTFPAELFTATPVVNVSVQVATYAAATTFTAEITAISSTSVTVRVNSGTVLNLLEAATNSCTVHIWAVGTAN